MKILYVTTISETIDAFLVPHILDLVECGHEVDIACKMQKPIAPELLRVGCKVYDIPFSRSPLSKDNLVAYRQLKALISANHYDIVHTHTPNASMCARFACRALRKTGLRVIYTAHGFHFYKGAPLINWFVFFPVERWMSRYTDVLITINGEDFVFAKKHLKAKQSYYIPGMGVDTEKFRSAVFNRSQKRREIGIPDDAFVLLSVGELNENKNHQINLYALAQMNQPNIYYVICGEGCKANKLDRIAAKLGIRDRVKRLGHRCDIAELVKASDLFVFPSRREGLGIASIEAMCCGLPLITSNVHGINDYSENGVTGFKCPPNDASAFAEAIWKLYRDPELRDRMGEHNIEAAKQYDLAKSLHAMAEIYCEVFQNERNSQRDCACV